MQILKTGRSEITSLAFSPDGQFLASAGGDSMVRIWDLTKGRHVSRWRALIPHDVAFSPDGRLFARTAFQTSLLIWDRQTKRELSVNGDPEQYGRHKLAFSPDGRILAITGSRLERIDVHDLQQLPSWTLPENNFVCIAFSPDGQKLATSHIFYQANAPYSEHSVIIWDAATGAELGCCPCTSRIIGLAISPDNRTLAACGGPSVWIWDLERYEQRKTLRSSRRHFRSVAFSPDGQFLATTSNDETARFWDTSTWQERFTFTWDIGRLTDIRFSPDGLRVAAGGTSGRIIIWDVDV